MRIGSFFFISRAALFTRSYAYANIYVQFTTFCSVQSVCKYRNVFFKCVPKSASIPIQPACTLHATNPIQRVDMVKHYQKSPQAIVEGKRLRLCSTRCSTQLHNARVSATRDTLAQSVWICVYRKRGGVGLVEQEQPTAGQLPHFRSGPDGCELCEQGVSQHRRGNGSLVGWS